MTTASINPDEIRSLLKAKHPQTARQVFYQTVEIQNPESYEALQQLLDDMETRGEIPPDWIIKPSR
jgi:hypothetical protein